MLVLRSQLTRRLYASCTLSGHRGYKSKSEDGLSSAPAGHEPGARRPHDPFRKMRKQSRRTAYIRTWDFIKSPAHALAIIRKVEEKYGPVLEYKFGKDYELPSEYQSTLTVVFKNQESFDRLPDQPEVFHAPEPLVLDQPGGIGLDDLKGLLEPRQRSSQPIPSIKELMGDVTKEMRESSTGKTIGCKIERALHERSTPSRLAPTGPSRAIRDQIGRRFLDWGGFYEMNPIDKGTPIMSDDLFGQSSLDHIKMRAILRKYSESTGTPNPYEYSSPSSHPPTNTAPMSSDNDLPEWEPLPGFEDDTSEIPPSTKLDTAPDSQSTGGLRTKSSP